MAILDILEFPDPLLRTVAKPVQKVDDKIQGLIDNMLETMYEAQGIGLAATQVNVHRQVIVIDLSEKKDAPLVLINPSFEVSDDEAFDYQEGCLSVPGFFEEVSRPAHIKVKALGRDGELFELVPDGLLAVCIQHEIDHLNGKLFVDHLSALKRNRIKQKN
jgi:peptide deformylase